MFCRQTNYKATHHLGTYKNHGMSMLLYSYFCTLNQSELSPFIHQFLEWPNHITSSINPRQAHGGGGVTLFYQTYALWSADPRRSFRFLQSSSFQGIHVIRVILKACAVLEQIEQMHAAGVSLKDSSTQLVLRCNQSTVPDNLLKTF